MITMNDKDEGKISYVLGEWEWMKCLKLKMKMTIVKSVPKWILLGALYIFKDWRNIVEKQQADRD